MAANFSEYISEKVLNRILNNGPALPVYTTVWAALFHNSGGITEANLRNNNIVNEISDTNYVRIPLTTSTDFAAAVAGATGMETKNAVQIDWDSAAVAYPNDVAVIALMDAVTGGNVIVYASITPTSVDIGKSIRITTDSLVVNL